MLWRLLLLIPSHARPAVEQRLVKHDTDFFALCYSPESVAGHKTQFSGKSFLAVVNRSLLSTRHLADTITLVVPVGDNGCTSLARTIPHIRIHHISVDVAAHGSWVNTMQHLKLMYMQSTHFAKYVYFELDMIMTPGAGFRVRNAFELNHAFDVAYTYRGKSAVYGSANTGLILYRRSEAMFRWVNEVNKMTARIINDKNESSSSVGAHNQVAVDRLGANNIKIGDVFSHAGTGATIFALSRRPLNTDGNCSKPHGPGAILHFNARSKPKILNRDCDKFL
mmetsp:Transcript_15375/g.49135  ORF Transcript_15375/g.49135 Transcript_15375/m.49135 type:complete len:280 (+) Transcript_15375:67-906(+)